MFQAGRGLIGEALWSLVFCFVFFTQSPLCHASTFGHPFFLFALNGGCIQCMFTGQYTDRTVVGPQGGFLTEKGA